MAVGVLISLAELFGKRLPSLNFAKRMRIHMLVTALASALLAGSCGEKAGRVEAHQEKWAPDLSDGEKLLRIVELAPAEVVPLEGVIESPGIYGIRVREAWDLKDRQDADGKTYSVFLRSPSSSPERPNSVGTIYGASNRFTPGEGITFEVANESPIPVTVAIYSQESPEKK